MQRKIRRRETQKKAADFGGLFCVSLKLARMKSAIIPLALTLLGGCISVQDAGGGTRFYRSLSPTQMGAAIFTKEIGPQDTAVRFAVLDAKVGDQPIEVGLVGDANWKGNLPKRAAWSKDGSVVAVQGADAKNWSHAYDFRTSHNFADVYPDAQRAAAIEKLLQTRGGIGPNVLNDWDQFDQVATPVAPNSR